MTDLPSPNATGSTPESAAQASPTQASPTQGVALIFGAAACWSLFPLFFKLVAHIPALEVLAHRSLWSLASAAVLMVALGRRDVFAKAFYAPAVVAVAWGAGLAVAVNWGVFIWAVAHDQVLQSSLGYYISPLVSVVLGVLILGERLRPLAWVAVGFAALGVALMVVRVGVVPWVALGLAFSWAIYGLVRKLAKVGSLPGLYLETLTLLPFALGYVGWLSVSGTGTVFGAGWSDSLLLMATGVATATPLLLFARAARILRLSTIGVLMYSVPTVQFLLAVFVFGEPFGHEHLVAFVLIWIGLALYGVDSVRANRRMRTVPPA